MFHEKNREKNLTILYIFVIFNLIFIKFSLFCLKVIWSVGKGSEIFRENSHLFDFHLKAYYVHSYMKIIHLKCA